MDAAIQATGPMRRVDSLTDHEVTDRVAVRFIPWMKRRGVKPDPNIEAVLHRRPVAGMIDGILLNELRQMTDLKEFAAAERVALQVSWHLHAVIAQKIPRI